KPRIGSKKLDLVKYGVFLAQLGLLPFFVINPAVAELKDNNFPTTTENLVRDTYLHYEISTS
ncbi:MAG: hypothetical protein AAFY76_26485, partial [Cyanobacteria bacterium J06649_11]